MATQWMITEELPTPEYLTCLLQHLFYSVPMIKGKITIALPISPDNIIEHLDLAMPEANRLQILQLHESITSPFSLTWVEKFPVSINPTVFYFYHL